MVVDLPDTPELIKIISYDEDPEDQLKGDLEEEEAELEEDPIKDPEMGQLHPE